MSRSNDIANITSSVLDGVTKAEVGLGNVDNTADSAKPVSTAQQTALDAKLATTTANSTYAPLASPEFTGTTTVADFASATPLSHRNMIINGGMQVWQRGVDVTCSDNSSENYNSVDRWFFNFNSGCPGTLDVDRSTDTPDGFGYSMKLKCNATGNPAASGDFINVGQRIEAQNLQHLGYGTSGAKTITLSWYMKSANYTSPITVKVEKPDSTSSYYLKSFTPTTSWTRYTMTLPALTGSTIANDSDIGLVVQFTLSGYSGGAQEQTGESSAWGTTYYEYINDVGNFFASTSNELYITGVQLELGSTATPFEHRTYGDELAKCQRYFWKIAGNLYQHFAIYHRFNTSNHVFPIHLPVPMRHHQPTINQDNLGRWSHPSGSWSTSYTTVSFYDTIDSENNFTLVPFQMTGSGSEDTGLMGFQASGYLSLYAELG